MWIFPSRSKEKVSTQAIVSPCKCQVSALGRWRTKLAPIISGWCTDLAKAAENEHLMERSWADLVKHSAVWEVFWDVIVQSAGVIRRKGTWKMWRRSLVSYLVLWVFLLSFSSILLAVQWYNKVTDVNSGKLSCQNMTDFSFTIDATLFHFLCREIQVLIWCGCNCHLGANTRWA